MIAAPPATAPAARRALRGAVLLLAAAAPAWADRPLVSETADVIPADACQLEAGTARMRTPGEPAATAAELLLSCGNRWNSQAGLLLGQVRSGGRTVRGAGLVGKTTLVMPDERTTGWALAYATAAEQISGRAWRQAATELRGVATRTLAPDLLGHLNLGWQRNHLGHQDCVGWSLGVERTGGLRWAADVFGDDRGAAWVSAGWLWPLADRFSLNFGAARQLGGERGRELTLGAKIEF